MRTCAPRRRPARRRDSGPRDHLASPCAHTCDFQRMRRCIARAIFKESDGALRARQSARVQARIVRWGMRASGRVGPVGPVGLQGFGCRGGASQQAPPGERRARGLARRAVARDQRRGPPPATRSISDAVRCIRGRPERAQTGPSSPISARCVAWTERAETGPSSQRGSRPYLRALCPEPRRRWSASPGQSERRPGRRLRWLYRCSRPVQSMPFVGQVGPAGLGSWPGIHRLDSQAGRRKSPIDNLVNETRSHSPHTRPSRQDSEPLAERTRRCPPAPAPAGTGPRGG